MKFTTIDAKVSFPKIEEQILQFWQQNSIFEKSVEQKEDTNRFFFYDGPPFATGLPHYGHILAGTIKDVIPRYQTMLGKKVERRFGWDCHGLPVEFEAEKELGFKGKYDIEQMGIAKFNEYCRSIVLRYTEEWKKSVQRMGRWADLKNSYKTMDVDFMESIWWVFQSLWKKGLIYQGSKIVAYSTRLHTPLSNFEVNLGYKDTQDPSVVIKFKRQDSENEYFLAWTTTPWTLVSNLALIINPKIQYVKIKYQNDIYYLSKSLVAEYFKDDFEILDTFDGQRLVGMHYEPIFPYFSHLKKQNAFQIFSGDFVNEKSGTGIVHCAPMFGEDDFEIGKKHKLPELLPLDLSAHFDDSVTDFKGLYFKDADKPIIKYLKDKKLLFKNSTLVHSYPFCWRSNTPLIYRAIPTWFVNVQKIKKLMVDNNQTIHWMPQHIKDGRMGKWLETAKDWAISRNRYWGTPIPVWVCSACDNQECLGSKSELEEKSGKVVDDLHRHFIDDIDFPCPKCQNSMQRVSEILDCWFESGAMPYGQEHYPFENKSRFDKAFPADFVSEGIDQTRGWFYTLLVLSNALFGKSAFKNIIVSGLLLAEDGKKMSKALKNYPDPNYIIDKYGADAIRLYLLNCAAIKAEEYCFSEILLKETAKNYLIPLWNSLSFFTTYANIDKWQRKNLQDISQLENPLDIWIISKLHSLIEEVRKQLDNYDLNRAVQPFLLFIDQLTNWYIRRSRRRFWKSEKAIDKEQAYICLYEILKKLAQVLAPFIPFIAEKIYLTLKNEKDPASVHLETFPLAQKEWIDIKLNQEMDKIISLVLLGRTLRAKSQIKVRQPLAKITVISSDLKLQKTLQKMTDLIIDELNVKRIEFLDKEEQLIELRARPNLPVLGPKYGKKMKQLTQQIKSLSSKVLFAIYSGENYKFQIDEEQYQITKNDLLFDRVSKSQQLTGSNQEMTIILDTKLSTNLVREGLSRELVHQIQQKRKDMNLKITDRIELEYMADEELTPTFKDYQNYIKQETLANKISEVDSKENLTSCLINDKEYFFAIHNLK